MSKVQYGERFALKDDNTWGPPAQQDTFETTTAKGKLRNVTLTIWHDLLMKGSKAQPMHRHPLDLLQIQVTDPTGSRLFKPQWLLESGKISQIHKKDHTVVNSGIQPMFAQRCSHAKKHSPS